MRTAAQVRRVVIVGAGLAGLRAAETLRDAGFEGDVTVIGDEAHPPYDRPPLSKQVLLGWAGAEGTALPRTRGTDDVTWQLGMRAVALDRSADEVVLGDGSRIGYDRVLVATGVSARRWPVEAEAGLDGVFAIHTIEDAARLRERLSNRPRRVLVVGGGFTGSETASVCRSLGLEVTLVEQGPAPLSAALGTAVADAASGLQRRAGVDLRTGTGVKELVGDGRGKLVQAKLSDGTVLDVDVAVVAIGGVRNTGWLAGSGLAAGPLGVTCDAACRAFDANGIVTDSIFAAGDVARFPHPAYDHQFLVLEHWKNADLQARVAARNMISDEHERVPHHAIPAFWSIQFETNIKSVGVPSIADEVMVAQGALGRGEFVAVYGKGGRIVAAASFNSGRWLDYYSLQIEEGSAFPDCAIGLMDSTADDVVPAGFPHPAVTSHPPHAKATGHSPTAAGQSPATVVDLSSHQPSGASL